MYTQNVFKAVNCNPKIAILPEFTATKHLFVQFESVQLVAFSSESSQLDKQKHPTQFKIDGFCFIFGWFVLCIMKK